MKKEDLIGRKVKGFLFGRTSDGFVCINPMSDYEGKVGVIEEYVWRDSVRVRFEDGTAWIYPIDLVYDHLVIDSKFNVGDYVDYLGEGYFIAGIDSGDTNYKYLLAKRIYKDNCSDSHISIRVLSRVDECMEGFIDYRNSECVWAKESQLSLNTVPEPKSEDYEKERKEILDAVHGGDYRTFDTGSVRDSNEGKPRVADMEPYTRLRFGYHMLLGAEKYSEKNYLLGQPDESSLESIHRHLALYEDGDRSEDHLCAIMFGIQNILLNEKKDGREPSHYYNLLKESKDEK